MIIFQDNILNIVPLKNITKIFADTCIDMDKKFGYIAHS